MSRVQSAERALGALLGCEPFPEAPFFPARINLPDSIFHKALAMVEATSQDDRERNARFYYQRERWRGSIALRGPKVKSNTLGLLAPKANLLNGIVGLIHRPHLELHTHINFQEEELKAQGGDLFASIYPRIYMLPSPGDITRSLMWSAHSAANMIASEGGNFLYVRTSVRNPGISSIDKEVQRSIDELRTIPYTENSEKTDVHQDILRTITHLLDPKFVVYFSEDHHDPVLHKVEVA